MSDQNQYLRVTSLQILSSGAMDYTFDPKQNCQVLEIYAHATGNISETITLTYISRDSSSYNTKLQATNLSTEADFAFRPTGHLVLMDGDKLRFQCTNATATATLYLTIIAEPYGHQKASAITSPGL